MEFTVTFVDGSSATYEHPARFRFEASGVLVIVVNEQQTCFSPMAWARVTGPRP